MNAPTKEFTPFAKIPRLRRQVVITEKLDGTNASIYISDLADDPEPFLVGSRNRRITPENDNYGFARWAYEHRDELTARLGPGHHFGEWWGVGIQRNYGLHERRFSLFNVARWKGLTLGAWPELPNVATVPVLYVGPHADDAIDSNLQSLRDNGSVAAPGFMDPEGIIVYHTASRSLFKVTCENDDEPKGKVRT